jgi:hypothetical protein
VRQVGSRVGFVLTNSDPLFLSLSVAAGWRWSAWPHFLSGSLSLWPLLFLGIRDDYGGFGFSLNALVVMDLSSEGGR